MSIIEDSDDSEEEEKATKAVEEVKIAPPAKPTPGVHSKVFMEIAVGNVDCNRNLAHESYHEQVQKGTNHKES